jgi:hypothetical protein
MDHGTVVAYLNRVGITAPAASMACLMINETNCPPPVSHLRHRSSRRPCLMINETGHVRT